MHLMFPTICIVRQFCYCFIYKQVDGRSCPPDEDHSPEDTKPAGKFLSVLTVLKILLWIVVFFLFVELEWGAVFVVFSAFFFIFTNMRSGRRKPWEPSAYSVFNPGCEPIEGTLKPEQFEREIRYGF